MGRLETTIVLLEELGGAVLAMLVLALALAGCGGGTTTTHTPGGGGSPGTQPPVPTLHVIAADTLAAPLAAGTAASYSPFTIPAASVVYQITERTTTVTQDTWTTAIVSASELARANAGQSYRGYALKTMVTGTTSGTEQVPADSYSLVVVCQNVLDDCVFSFQIQATY